MSRRAIVLLLAQLVLIPAGMTANAAADEIKDLSPKGIYLDVDKHQRTGVKFWTLLRVGKKEHRVSTSHDFRSGDRFRFGFEINRDCYLYVVNRTIIGNPDTLHRSYEGKSISRVRDDDRQRAKRRFGPPHLLFPTRTAGMQNRLRAAVAHLIPQRDAYFMDREYGIEKLYVVVSDKPLDMARYFDPGSGEIHRQPGSRLPDPEVLAGLNDKLVEWSRNADVELVTKGIWHEAEGYGVSIDPSQPAMVEIDLRHYW